MLKSITNLLHGTLILRPRPVSNGMKKQFLIISTILFGLPLVSFAQPKSYNELIQLFIGFLPDAVLIIGMFITLYFVWRIATFILTAGDKENREKAKRLFLWGILALFITLSLYGILSFVLSELGFGTPVIPKLPEQIPDSSTNINYENFPQG